MALDRTAQAQRHLQDAYQAQMEGDYDRAVELYRRSLALHPTAEAHTFLGWTFHFQGKIDEAIPTTISAHISSASNALMKPFRGSSGRLPQNDMILGIFRISTWDAPI